MATPPSLSQQQVEAENLILELWQKSADEINQMDPSK